MDHIDELREIPEGTELLSATIQALQQRDWRRTAVDTLTSPDGVTVRHHYTNRVWELRRTAPGKPPVDLSFTDRYVSSGWQIVPLPTTAELVAFCETGVKA